MKGLEKKLCKLDDFIYRFLKRNVNIMPKRFVKLIAFYYTDARIRKIYLHRLGVTMGEGTLSNPGFFIVGDGKEDRVVIGKNVSIAPYVMCVTDCGPNNGKEIKNIPYVKDVLIKDEPIIIEDEVWIGANVTILPGVRIGKSSVIGAGSVVTKDVEAYSIYAGVPARKIRSLKAE